MIDDEDRMRMGVRRFVAAVALLLSPVLAFACSSGDTASKNDAVEGNACTPGGPCTGCTNCRDACLCWGGDFDACYAHCTGQDPLGSGGASAGGGSSAGSGGQPDAATTFVTGGTTSTGGVASTGGAPAVIVPPRSFDAAGPYPVTTDTNVGPLGGFTVFRPTVLGASGERHAIITWGNGGGAQPETYAPLLQHLASYGFVIVASNSEQAGSGQEMLQGIDWLVGETASSASPYFGKLDPSRIGATGHSQGGGGALVIASDPRVTTVAPIEPAPTTISLHQPLLLLCGGADTTIAPDAICRDLVYSQVSVPTFYGVLNAADHLSPTWATVTNGFMGPLAAWFMLQLSGDETARGHFYGDPCGLCSDPDWTVLRKNL